MIRSIGLDFISYDVDLMNEENYRPEYVAMRNLGRENRPLIGEHDWTGSTSGDQMGFDPLVVPTLVDNLKKKVIADSKTIINYLEKEIPLPSLYPDDCMEMVEKHVKIVDNTPHAGLLYGGDPDKDTRPGNDRFIYSLCFFGWMSVCPDLSPHKPLDQ